MGQYQKTGGVVARDWEFLPGFLYTQVRAISARVNQNYDGWPSAELKKSYRSFVGKPVFVNHQNEDPELARGRVVAARYVERGPDKYIETVMEIDAKRFPKLAKEIISGGLDSVSMGVEAGFTICSVCDNKATDVWDMCKHIKFRKGEMMRNEKTGKKTLVYENCFKLGFFELSYVFDPADETAVVSRVIAASKTPEKKAFRIIAGAPWTRKPDSDKLHAMMGGGHSLHVFPPHKVAPIYDPGNLEELAPGTGSERHEWVHTQGGEPINSGFASTQQEARMQAEQSHKELAGGWDPDNDPFDPRQFGAANAKCSASLQKKRGGSDEDMPGVPARNARGVRSAARPVQGVLPESLSTRGTGRGSSPIQASAGQGLQHEASHWYTADQSGRRICGIESGERSRQSRQGQLGERAQARHGADPRTASSGGRGSAPQEQASGRQPARELGAVDDVSTGRSQSRGPNRVARRAPQGGRDSSSWYRPTVGDSLMRQSNDSRYNAERAPEDIDTLRDESEDDTDLFHHWVESPQELRAPDMDKTQRLDREQESQGLDDDRNAENAEDFGGAPQAPQFADDQEQEPVMPINPPELKKGRRNKNRGARMSGYHFYAADEDGDDGDFGGSESDDEDTQTPEDSDSDDGGGADDGGADPQSGDDIHDLLDEAQSDIDSFEQDPDSGYDDDASDDGDSFGDDDDYSDEAGEDSDPSDDYAGDEAGGSDEGGEDQGGGEDPSGGSQPPWLQEGNVNRQASRRNKRGGTMTGSTLSERGRVASRGRRHIADDGHTDGGPYGIDDSQGNQEDVFISQVPGAEPVAAPAPDDPQISNSPGNLVAYKRPKFDAAHYQRLADVVKALPPEQRGAMARNMVAMLSADNKSFNGKTFYAEANVPVVKRGNRYFYAEGLESPDKVDPGLSGTDVSDLKGDDFESLALDNVETQPKDASIHAFRQFDAWLAQATGKTANQHRNANFIRRAAATYAKQWQQPQAKLATLFPTLDYVLAEARKFEGGNMRKRAEDESLSVAAPQDRIDVEAPVKNVTDADAQASQFDTSDFAHNAGDQLADPVLDAVDGNAGTWAPDKGKEASVKLATAVEAVRLAEAYIAAYPNSYSDKDRWTLTGQFETLRQAVVRDRTRLLEAVVEDHAKAPKTARKVSAASSRGTKGSIPPGFASGRTASTTRRASASDPATDYGLFL
jgi:hypothetical protein